VVERKYFSPTIAPPFAVTISRTRAFMTCGQM
jgi:hypothetical protein